MGFWADPAGKATSWGLGKDPIAKALPGAAGDVYRTAITAAFAPHKLLSMGKGDKARATGQFDQASAQARSDIENFLGSTEAARRQSFQESVQRGIGNREAAKMMEVSRMVGPHLEATNVQSVPGFLGGGGLYSGADRGTDYGRALEGAIGQGQSSVAEIPVELGAKGTSRGIANEAIPRYQSTPMFNPLMPEAQLHQQAAQYAASQGKKGAK